MIVTKTERTGTSVTSIEHFRVYPIKYETRDANPRLSGMSRNLAAGATAPSPAALHSDRTARCGECSIDPAHPQARVCIVANCPIRHVAASHHARSDAA